MRRMRFEDFDAAGGDAVSRGSSPRVASVDGDAFSASASIRSVRVTNKRSCSDATGPAGANE